MSDALPAIYTCPFNFYEATCQPWLSRSVLNLLQRYSQRPNTNRNDEDRPRIDAGPAAAESR